jgi:hypothetical protein
LYQDFIMPPDDDSELTQPEQTPDDLGQEDFSSGGSPPETEGGDQPQADSTPQGGEQEPAPLTIRGLVESLGYNFGGQTPPDDYTALAHLVHQATEARRLSESQRQTDVYTQLGQRLAPKAQEIQGFLQQPKPVERKPYEPPQFDPRWAELVTRDQATGLYVAKQGVPASIADAANRWADWQSSFVADPAKVIQPLVEERASAIAEAKVKEAMDAYRREQDVFTLARQNADWFYSKDANGQFLLDPLTGQHQITQAGNQYLGLVRTLGEYGISNPLYRDQVARALLAAQVAPQTPTPTATAAATRQGQALARGRPQRNVLQSLGSEERRGTRGATEPDANGHSVRESLEKAFKEQGITDETFAGSDAFSG